MIPVIYPSWQHQHAPEAEYDQGHITLYSDVPARIDNMLTALAALPSVHITACSDTVSSAEVEAVHTSGVRQYIQTTSAKSSQNGSSYIYPSVFPGYFAQSPGVSAKNLLGGMHAFDVHAPIGAGTATAVFNSAATSLTAAQVILDGQANLSYALCRPPGHHAGRNFTGGYCYLNNAALAAHHLKAWGRAAILDIDYHHGNGTQDITWQDPDIFFASLHADPAFEYPYYTGYAEETGGTQAPHTVANFPLPQGTDDLIYLQALQAALNAIDQYNPVWLVISLGFDTFGGDPLSTFTLSQAVYHEIGRLIASLNRPTVLVQEGGYNVAQLGLLAREFLTGFLSNQTTGETQHAASIR